MDNSIFYFFNNFLFQYHWLDTIVWFFAEPFIYIVIASIIILFILKTEGKKIFLILFSGGLAWVLAVITKILIHTDRPFVALSDAHSLFYESGYAFPSGHSATISALAFSIFFLNKRLGCIFIVAAILIGVARIVAGVHFPVDILGGYLLGFAVAFLLKSR